MDSTQKNLLFYTEVRWLSKGNMLARAFELREEFLQFSVTIKKNETFVKNLSDENWFLKFAYLTDIFDYQ